MEELLASQSKKLTALGRGELVEGEIVSISPKEVIIDFGAKSEGVLPGREIPQNQLNELKIGDKLKAYVAIPENEYGQTVLSKVKSTGREAGPREGRRGGRTMDWNRFKLAQSQKTKMQAKVLEVNKGGLIVEVPGARGFLPNSQVGFELLSKASKVLPAGRQGMEELIGQTLIVTIIEVDQNNNKLIFSERGEISEEIKEKLAQYKKNQKIKGKIAAVLPFGLVVDVAGLEGLVFISDVSWEKTYDLESSFKAGDEIDVAVLGQDEDFGRLNLSIKHLSEDPFVRIADKFPVDEVVKGEIATVSEVGVTVALDGAEGPPALSKVEGFLPASKMDPAEKYETGQSMTFLVDSVDKAKRRVNLAPFVTSTSGLIYK